MYLLVTHIPIYVDGTRLYLDQGWFPDVMLARDWLAPPFGPLVIVAPWLPLPENRVRFEEVTPSMGVRLVPTFDARCRARRFWLRERSRWLRTVRRELAGAAVVHASVDDLYRPMAQLAFRAAVRAGVPTVLVGPDMDVHEVWSEDLKRGPVMERMKKWMYLRILDRAIASHLKRADLALLKEGAVYGRYAGVARNAKAFCQTMYRTADVIPEEDLERRLSQLASGATLRLVYCGRLIHRKGLHVAIDVVRRARQEGIPAEFDVIGAGPEESTLRAQIERHALSGVVRLCGQTPYGPALLRRLANYDLMLFSPIEEDTPRMLYDGYAAGLPFLGAAIPFLQYRARADRAGILFPVQDAAGGSRELAALHHERSRLAELARRARAAALEHAVEHWYGRRAAWTIEAVERRRRQLALDGQGSSTT